jgi:hypothetical protein
MGVDRYSMPPHAIATGPQRLQRDAHRGPFYRRRPGTVERAFEIAQSGQAVGISEVRAVLCREGYSDGLAQTAGRELSARLTGSASS